MARKAFPTKEVALDRGIDDLLAGGRGRVDLPPGPDYIQVKELMDTARLLRAFCRVSPWPGLIAGQ